MIERIYRILLEMHIEEVEETYSFAHHNDNNNCSICKELKEIDKFLKKGK